MSIPNLPAPGYLASERQSRGFTAAERVAIEEDKRRWHAAVVWFQKPIPDAMRWLNTLPTEYREDMRARLNQLDQQRSKESAA